MKKPDINDFNDYEELQSDQYLTEKQQEKDERFSEFDPEKEPQEDSE